MYSCRSNLDCLQYRARLDFCQPDLFLRQTYLPDIGDCNTRYSLPICISFTGSHLTIVPSTDLAMVSPSIPILLPRLEFLTTVSVTGSQVPVNPAHRYTIGIPYMVYVCRVCIPDIVYLCSRQYSYKGDLRGRGIYPIKQSTTDSDFCQPKGGRTGEGDISL